MATDKGEATPPPPDFGERTLPIASAARLARPNWFRIGKTIYAPKYFSQDDGWRFSHPGMPGTLYVGDSPGTCFWEVFWSDLVTRPVAERRLDRTKVEERSAWTVALPAGLRLVNTFDADGLREMGSHGGTFSGPYAICQQWAKAIREHPQKPHGILYESVRDVGHDCIALFEEHCAGIDFDFQNQTALIECAELAAELSKYGVLPSLRP